MKNSFFYSVNRIKYIVAKAFFVEYKFKSRMIVYVNNNGKMQVYIYYVLDSDLPYLIYQVKCVSITSTLQKNKSDIS